MDDDANRPRLLVSVVGVVTIVGYAVLAGVNALVLNPLAHAPGRTMAQIHADLAGARESLGEPMVIAILALGPLLAVGWATFAYLRRLTPLDTAAGHLVLIVLGTPAVMAAGFGPGMALGDTYVSGEDRTPWAVVLGVVSAVTALALATWGFRRRSTAAHTDGREPEIEPTGFVHTPASTTDNR